LHQVLFQQYYHQQTLQLVLLPYLLNYRVQHQP
jgi:hypothetical protein